MADEKNKFNKKILFIVNDANKHPELYKSVAKFSNQWEVEVVSTTQEAQTSLENQTAGVVIADELIGSDGTGITFLGTVSETWPETQRILMVSASHKISVNTIGIAHQFLAFPFDGDAFQDVIGRGVLLQNLLANPNLMRIVSRMKTIPGLPKVYLDLLALLRRPDVSMQKVGHIVSQDIGLTAKMLQLVNTAQFGISRRITNPVQAANFLGINTVKTIVLSLYTFSQFKPNNCPGLEGKQLWSHSVVCGSLARFLAGRLSGQSNVIDDALVAGLLHDTGKLILASYIPVQYGQIINESRKKAIPLVEVEQQVLGTTHCDVGAALLGLWGLPESVVKAVAFHHKPSDYGETEFTALTATHIADALAHLTQRSTIPIPVSLDEEYLVALGLEEKLEELMTSSQAFLQPKRAA